MVDGNQVSGFNGHTPDSTPFKGAYIAENAGMNTFDQNRPHHMSSSRPALCFLILALICACGGREKGIYPSVGSITESVYASGMVKARGQYALYPAVQGTVRKLIVREGDTVVRGQALIRINDDKAGLQTRTARQQAEFSATAANKNRLQELAAVLELAEKKRATDSALFTRQQNLWSQQIGSRFELEQRELAWESSRTAHERALAQYAEALRQIRFEEDQARTRLELSRLQEDDFTVRAEADGLVYRILVEEGEAAGPQSPVAILGAPDDFYLELSVDEYDITRIQKGQRVFVALDSYRGQVFEARLEKINPLFDERSRAFTVEAEWVNPPPRLYPNLTAEANIMLAVRDSALTIPRAYLLPGDSVWLESGQKRKVRVGLRDFRKVEILEGLNRSERILQPE